MYAGDAHVGIDNKRATHTQATRRARIIVVRTPRYIVEQVHRYMIEQAHRYR